MTTTGIRTKFRLRFRYSVVHQRRTLRCSPPNGAYFAAFSNWEPAKRILRERKGGSRRNTEVVEVLYVLIAGSRSLHPLSHVKGFLYTLTFFLGQAGVLIKSHLQKDRQTQKTEYGK